MGQLGLLSLATGDTQALAPLTSYTQTQIETTTPLLKSIDPTLLQKLQTPIVQQPATTTQITPTVYPLAPVIQQPAPAQTTIVPNNNCVDCGGDTQTLQTIAPGEPTTTQPGGFFKQVTDWVHDNPLLAFLLGAGTVYLLTRKKKSNA